MEILELLWRYCKWANDILLMTLENYGDQTPAASLRLMSHIANTQCVWLARINGQVAGTGIWEEHDLATCKQLNRESLDGILQVIERPAGELSAIVAYKNSSGIAYETSVFDMLLQVLNHGTYHRAQIAMALRQAGLEPVNTDYISWVRANRP